jgi:hypothetical protein
MEGWPSGSRRTIGNRMGITPRAGSNPVPSAKLPIMKPIANPSHKFAIILTSFFFIILFLFSTTIHGEQQYSYLANSFLHGKLHFIDQLPSWNDAILHEGNYYWPPSPLPAIILMPFVLIFSNLNMFFYQGYLQFVLVLATFYLLLKIHKKNNYSYEDSLWLSIAFCFSSVYMGVALWPWSWQFSQIVSALLVLLSFYEYFTKRRYLVIGILFAFILATRLASAIGVVFFFLSIFLSNETRKTKLRNVWFLFIPVVLSAGMLMG